MSDKLSEIETRITSAHQLETVIAAMRGIAAARSREAQARLPGIRASAATVGEAIGKVLSIASPATAVDGALSAHKRSFVVVFGAEQGFVGSLNERIVASVARHRAQSGATTWECLMAGTRCTMLAQEHGLPLVWSGAMASRADDVVRLASRVTDALYDRLQSGADGAASVVLIHATPGAAPGLDLAEYRLLPFDYSRFDATPNAIPPIHTLPPARLLTGLVQAYVFVELCEAATLAFAAENEARVRAMIAAASNVRTKLDELSQHYRRVRQDEITSDILELAAGAQA